jgi:hypothetical protein
MRAGFWKSDWFLGVVAVIVVIAIGDVSTSGR